MRSSTSDSLIHAAPWARFSHATPAGALLSCRRFSQRDGCGRFDDTGVQWVLRFESAAVGISGDCLFDITVAGHMMPTVVLLT